MTRRSRPAARSRRILVVAPNWLGDVVMATPLLDWLDAVRRADGGPALEIALSVRAAWAPLLAGDRRLDALLVTERPGRHDGPRGIAREAARWRAGGYDAVLLGPPSLRAALTAALAGIRVRIGHRGDGRAPLLSHALPRAARGTRHYTREMVDLGVALGEAWDWSAVAPAGDGALATRLATAPERPGDDDGRPLWVLGPGTTFGPAKNWPAGPMAAFMAAAVRGRGVRFVLLGDGGAAGIVAQLREHLPHLRWGGGDARDADVTDRTGQTSLVEAVACIGRAQLYVGNDSGLMHVAAAMGVPTVGLFGSSNPAWTRPGGPAVAVVAADGFACRPCYRRTCNQPVFCLSTIEGEQVLAAAAGVLAAPAGRGNGRAAP